MRIGLAPLVIGRLSENVPSFPAVPVIDWPVSSLRAMIVVRPWVRPSSVTALRLMTAPSRGALSLIDGLVWSRIQRTIGDASDSPPGPISVTEKSLRPLVRVTGMIVLAVGASSSLVDRARPPGP